MRTIKIPKRYGKKRRYVDPKKSCSKCVFFIMNGSRVKHCDLWGSYSRGRRGCKYRCTDEEKREETVMQLAADMEEERLRKILRKEAEEKGRLEYIKRWNKRNNPDRQKPDCMKGE